MRMYDFEPKLKASAPTVVTKVDLCQVRLRSEAAWPPEFRRSRKLKSPSAQAPWRSKAMMGLDISGCLPLVALRFSHWPGQLVLHLFKRHSYLAVSNGDSIATNSGKPECR